MPIKTIIVLFKIIVDNWLLFQPFFIFCIFVLWYMIYGDILLPQIIAFCFFWKMFTFNSIYVHFINSLKEIKLLELDHFSLKLITLFLSSNIYFLLTFIHRFIINYFEFWHHVDGNDWWIWLNNYWIIFDYFWKILEPPKWFDHLLLFSVFWCQNVFIFHRSILFLVVFTIEKRLISRMIFNCSISNRKFRSRIIFNIRIWNHTFFCTLNFRTVHNCLFNDVHFPIVLQGLLIKLWLI